MNIDSIFIFILLFHYSIHQHTFYIIECVLILESIVEPDYGLSI